MIKTKSETDKSRSTARKCKSRQRNGVNIVNGIVILASDTKTGGRTGVFCAQPYMLVHSRTAVRTTV